MLFASCRLMRMNERNFHAQSHGVFLSHHNSHLNEPNFYYRTSITFFCSDFVAYIRRKTVGYGFYDTIFMLNAASNRGGRPIFEGEWYLLHDLKNKLLILLIDCSLFHWNDFFGNPESYLVRNHFIYVNKFIFMFYVYLLVYHMFNTSCTMNHMSE